LSAIASTRCFFDSSSANVFPYIPATISRACKSTSHATLSHATRSHATLSHDKLSYVLRVSRLCLSVHPRDHLPHLQIVRQRLYIRDLYVVYWKVVRDPIYC
jgi:hypothetical protein